MATNPTYGNNDLPLQQNSGGPIKETPAQLEGGFQCGNIPFTGIPLAVHKLFPAYIVLVRGQGWASRAGEDRGEGGRGGMGVVDALLSARLGAGGVARAHANSAHLLS